MLRPEKHLGLKYCLVNVSAEIVTSLRRTRALRVDEIEDSIIERLGEQSRAMVVRALTLLYSLGVIDFDDRTDVIYLQRSTEGTEG